MRQKKSGSRNRNGKAKGAKFLHSIENVKRLLKNTLFGSIQMGENCSLTRHQGIILDKPTVALANALLHVKFHYKFMLGVIHRKPNGVPAITVQFVDFNTHAGLYSDELSDLIFTELKRMFEKSDHSTRLTTFWIAAPNPEMPDEDFLQFMFPLLDKYRVYDNFISQYEIDNKIEPSRSLHKTSYWYGLVDVEEITWE